MTLNRGFSILIKSMLAQSVVLIGGTVIALGTSKLAHAADVEANVALTSNYVWRGISQTRDEAAIQGGFDASTDTGWYAGAWGSNVSYPDTSLNAHLEIDIYGGYATTFDNGWRIDAGAIRYVYPGSAITGVNEIYVGAGYGVVDVKAYHSPDAESLYVELGAGWTLSEHWQLALHGGHYDFENATDFAHFGLSIGRTLGSYEITLGMNDTDLADGECASVSRGSDLCSNVWISVATSF